MIKFHIAEASNTVNVSVALVLLMEQSPELFRDGLKIESFFGSPPVIWNGGRILFGQFREDKVKRMTDAYNEKGVRYRFTFTNPMLTEKDLEDKAGNALLDIADNGMNEVIINSPLLEQYIRQTHPRIRLTSSTCKCIRSIEEVKAELARDYSLVVLDYNFNNEFEELEKLTPGERKRCELLANCRCIPDCPRRPEHYRHIGNSQLRANELRYTTSGDIDGYGLGEWKCPYMAFDPRTPKTKRYIEPDVLYTKYADMGFENFKLEGRAASFITLCEYITAHLVKPEERDAARYYLLRLAETKWQLCY